MKAIVRLGLGWLLMLVGAFLLMDSALAVKSRGQTMAGFEALAGCGLAVGGFCLRRRAVSHPGNS